MKPNYNDYLSPKDYNKCKNALRSEIRKQFRRSEYCKKFVASKRVEWTEKLISEKFNVSYRKRVSYPCEGGCEGLYQLKEIEVDHKNPIGRGVLNNIEDIFDFFKLVYCPYDNLQLLCKTCHKGKTKQENKAPSFDNAKF